MPLWLQLIVTCALSAGAAYAAAYWGRVFASSQLRKRITELETDVATLTSEYSKVMALSKKISQRVALDDHRHKANGRGRSDGPPPPGATKAELREYYLKGRTQKEIAAMHAGGRLDG